MHDLVGDGTHAILVHDFSSVLFGPLGDQGRRVCPDLVDYIRTVRLLTDRHCFRLVALEKCPCLGAGIREGVEHVLTTRCGRDGEKHSDFESASKQERHTLRDVCLHKAGVYVSD